MASKYKGLKGNVPKQPTERDDTLRRALGSIPEGQTPEQLTTAYNEWKQKYEDGSAVLKKMKGLLDAYEIRIIGAIDAASVDAITVSGYTWTEKTAPYPTCEDVDAVIKYFHENGMEDQLRLNASELARRVENHVKQEALDNELRIEVTTEVDPETGEEREKREVYSNIPGVKVFLKSSMSRTKSTKGAK